MFKRGRPSGSKDSYQWSEVSRRSMCPYHVKGVKYYLTLKRAYPYPSIFFMDFPIAQELSNIMHSYFVLFIFYIDSNGLQSYEL
jgi:hypothetical protein